MATTAAKPEVFSRKASGLSRVMSPWSAFMYNFLTMGVIFPWTFVWAPAAFPGVSVWKACLLAIVLELPIALAYVWMATAMPRSGGDYVFQSRVLGGAIGFPVVMSGFVIWILQWVALAGWLLATLGVAPLLMGLGVNWKNQGLIDAAVWCQSSAGVVTISIIGAAAMAILLVTGFKNYVRLQYLMFAATGILVVILLVQFLRTDPAQFAVSMNHFSNVVDGREGYYQWLLKDVSSAGIDLNPKIVFSAILLATPIVWTSLQWATYSVEQGGEIKGARVFKNQMFIIVGSMIAMGCALALIAWAEERAVGTAFFNAVSHSYYYGVSASGRRDRQHPALPGHVRDRDRQQLDHHDPRGRELHARLAADHLQLLHRHDPRHGRHVARPHAAGLVLQGEPALPLAGQRAPHLLPAGRRVHLRLQLLGPVVLDDPGRHARLRLRVHHQLPGGRAAAVPGKGALRGVSRAPSTRSAGSRWSRSSAPSASCSACGR